MLVAENLSNCAMGTENRKGDKKWLTKFLAAVQPVGTEHFSGARTFTGVPPVSGSFATNASLETGWWATDVHIALCTLPPVVSEKSGTVVVERAH